jgi:hypothetical protein
VHSFQDSTGQGWDVVIDFAAVKRLRGALNIDLCALADGVPTLGARLSVDVVLMVDALYVLCRRQAEDRQVSDEDFGRAVAGVFAAATAAFWQELTDFFQPLRAATANVARSYHELELARTELARQTREWPPAASSTGPTNSPEQSASTPAA